MEEKATEKQIGGNHYKGLKIQPAEYIHANGLDFFQGNIVKYITRFRQKNGKQDLEKIKHYCDLLIEFEYSDKEVNPIKMEEGDMILDGRVYISPSQNFSFEIPEGSNPSQFIKP